MLNYNDGINNGLPDDDGLKEGRSNEIPTGNELSMAQLFQLELLRRQIEGLPLNDSHDYLFEMFRQMMVKDNLVKDLFKGCYL
jgi:Phycobilisome degradation protein nblA